MATQTIAASAVQTTTDKAQHILDLLKRDVKDCRPNDPNYAFAAHQRGQVEGLQQAIGYLENWLAEELAAKVAPAIELKDWSEIPANERPELNGSYANVKGSAHAGFNYKFEKAA